MMNVLNNDDNNDDENAAHHRDRQIGRQVDRETNEKLRAMTKENSYKIKRVYKIDGNRKEEIRSSQQQTSIIRRILFQFLSFTREKTAHVMIIIQQSYTSTNRESFQRERETMNTSTHTIFDLSVNIYIYMQKDCTEKGTEKTQKQTHL